MKLLIVSVFPPTQLAEADHAYHLCSQLADDGVDVHVLTQKGSVVPARKGLHVHPIMQRWSWREMPRMAACFKRIAPDAVLIMYVGHMYNFQPAMTFSATVARKLLPGKSIFTMFEHGGGVPIAKRGLKGILRRGIHRAVRLSLGRQVDYSYGTLLRDSDRIVVLTSSHLKHFEQAFPDVEAKSVVIPPAALLMMSPPDDGAARAEQRAGLGVKPGDTLLVYFGYIYHNKGLDTLLPAFEIVCQDRDDVHLMLVGGTVQASSDHAPGYAQEMQSLADRLQCRDKIHFTGGYDWDSDHASRRLRAADIAVLPFDLGVHINNSSVAGVVSHGLPLITTCVEPLESQFVHERNVLLVTPQEPIEMAAAIRRVLNDAPLRETLRQGARQLADEWFSLSANAGRVLDAFNEARATRKAGLISIPADSPVRRTLTAGVSGRFDSANDE